MGEMLVELYLYKLHLGTENNVFKMNFKFPTLHFKFCGSPGHPFCPREAFESFGTGVGRLFNPQKVMLDCSHQS